MTNKNFLKLDTELTLEIIKECGSNGLMLYVLILSHRNTKTNKCFPSMELLTKESTVSKSTVQRAIRKLHEKGFLIIDSGKQGVSNSYYFPRESFYKGEGVGAVKGRKGNFNKKKGDK